MDILELESIISEMKHSLDSINSRLYTVEGSVNMKKDHLKLTI